MGLWASRRLLNLGNHCSILLMLNLWLLSGVGARNGSTIAWSPMNCVMWALAATIKSETRWTVCPVRVLFRRHPVVKNFSHIVLCQGLNFYAIFSKSDAFVMTWCTYHEWFCDVVSSSSGQKLAANQKTWMHFMTKADWPTFFMLSLNFL